MLNVDELNGSSNAEAIQKLETEGKSRPAENTRQRIADDANRFLFALYHHTTKTSIS